VGGCTRWIQFTHSLKSPGFNPRGYEVKNWFLKVCFFKFNLYRATTRKVADSLKQSQLNMRANVDVQKGWVERLEMERMWGPSGLRRVQSSPNFLVLTSPTPGTRRR
jgi:hypothetical protein